MSNEVNLKRRFDLVYTVAILVGLMTGSGIYIAPSGMMRRVPSPGVALVAWAIAGISTLFVALLAAELATTFATAGGRYNYLRTFYGSFPGFLHVCVYTFVTMPCTNVIKGFITAR